MQSYINWCELQNYGVVFLGSGSGFCSYVKKITYICSSDMRTSVRHLLPGVTIVAVLLAGYGGWLPPLRFGLVPALMVLAYPIVVVAALLLAAYWMLRRRRWDALTVIAAVAATWPSLRSNFLPGFNWAATANGCDTFSVMSYNVEGFIDKPSNDSTRLHPSMQLVLDCDADFVVLQQPNNYGLNYLDLRCIKPWRDSVATHYPFRSHSTHDGVELLSKHPFTIVQVSVPEISYRYFPHIIRWHEACAYDIELPQGRQLRILGAYMTSFELDSEQRQVLESAASQSELLPSVLAKLRTAFARRQRQAQRLRRRLDSSPDNVVLCMDLNDVPQSCAYRTILGGDMEDAYVQCGSGPMATYREHRLLFHIDHILYRGAPRAIGFERCTGGSSDHHAIVATFAWNAP